VTRKLHKLLSGQSKEWLLDQLVLAAKADPAIRARLETLADPARAPAPNPAAGKPKDKAARLRATLSQAIEVEDVVADGALRAYIGGIEPALQALETMTTDDARAALELAEYSLGLFEDAFRVVDDADGELARMALWAHQLHLAACASARPDPAEFGARLARIAIDLRYLSFLNLPDGYEDVLGEVGLRRFARVIDDRWRRLPELTPGAGHPSTQRSVLTALQQKLAARQGPDALVGVIGRDLSRSWNFVHAARVLADAGRPDDALQWTERGLAAFADEPYSGLRELRASLLAELGRPPG
jgi:hypothetical protein